MSIILDGTAGITFPSGSNPQAAPSKVLQVVSATYSTQVSNSTNTYADTGLTASITPLFSTSKILIFVSIAGCSKQGSSAGNSIDLQLVRGSTSILQFEGALGYTNSVLAQYDNASANYLDSPATTSATTYKVQFAADANAANVLVQGPNNRIATSTMTLMEIAA